MTELLTAAQMRAIEKAAIDSGDVTGLDLMERAGRGVVDAIFEHWPKMADRPQHAVVLCGPGNNGGDGFVVARRLADKGWTVELLFWGDKDKQPPDAARMRELWEQTGETRPLTVEAASEGVRPALLVDAMFGTGIKRPIPLDCAKAFQAVRKRKTGTDTHPWLVPFQIVAVDCPSGFDCDTGEFLFPEFENHPETPEDAEEWHQRVMVEEVYPRLLHVALTVTFHRAKIGHFLNEAGITRPVVKDIGLSATPVTTGAETSLFEPPTPEHEKSVGIWLRHHLHLLSASHKYERGHALILAGGHGKGGAGRLAARAALRVGAGLVTVGVAKDGMLENACQLNAIMLAEMNSAEDLTALLEDDRISAVGIGPGFGVGQRTRDFVAAALAKSEISSGYDQRRFVLDADALTSFQDEPEALFSACHDRVVLTPHLGEFKRLFPDLAEQVSVTQFGRGLSRPDAVRQAAARSGAIVLLKGPTTVMAAPDGRVLLHPAIYDRRAPQLATAGSGDVLAGLILGAASHPQASFSMLETVACAAWLHVECARTFGPGLIAEDLPDVIPQVFRSLCV